MSRLFWAMVLGLCVGSEAGAKEPTVGSVFGLEPRVILGCGGSRVDLGPPQTIRERIAESSVVFFGTASHSRLLLNNKGGAGCTDLTVEAIVKNSARFKFGEVVTLPYYLPIENPKKPPRYLVLCEVQKGQLNPSGILNADSDLLLTYLQGARKLDPSKPGEALVYYLKHLHSPEYEVDRDALNEICQIPYRELRTSAQRLSADQLVLSLEQGKGSQFQRRGLCIFLLGHCGTKRHAELLGNKLDRLQSSLFGELESLLISYTLLAPGEGRERMRAILADPKQHFLRRRDALRAVRFFLSHRPDVLSHHEAFALLALLLEQPDICALAIELIRERREPRFLRAILALDGRKGYEAPIIRRSILCFALTFADKPEAAGYIEAIRARDPQAVASAEEFLQLEKEATRGTAPKS